MEHAIPTPNPWMIVPFGLLLGAIALAPLLAAKWWHQHYPKVAYVLGAIVLAYYLLGLHAAARVGAAAHEYISFIALVGSLYIVSGGIHIGVKGEATPLRNVVFLAIGAVIANLFGTTGASMLLIRPWIRMNKYRITAFHVVFFIFIVSNVGGCLTPIGDPPLFLGYLMGIPFWWVAEHCWPMWFLGNVFLLAVFYVLDRRNFLRAPREIREVETAEEKLKFDGLINLAFLGVILGSVFINKPIFLREALMFGAALGSWFLTPKRVHKANAFDFGPIREVTILFIGIFATMMPALDWLSLNSGKLLGDAPSPGLFFWGTGILSSVLDNAPTYLSFLSATFGTFVDKDVIQQVAHLVETGGSDLVSVTGAHADQIRNTFATLQKYHADQLLAKTISVEEIEICFLLGNAKFNAYILAISIGAVFFGANTYIGNGPNFMVKSIAEQQGVNTPTFLGYIARFTLPFMMPMLLIAWLVFFR